MPELRPDQPPAPVGAPGDFADWHPDARPLPTRIDGTRAATVTVPGGAAAADGYLAAGDYWFDATAPDRPATTAT
ncbi:hypothetical protein [Streptomyces antimicrobicus]|uniref:Uncharacterized protein n=1 Tax=Streptomyces antimicrobicus TaxID=2883108 RepID=A0ABS8BDY5_9ACTN|nr:hypothetical protein [Streptomyces antimicrobicus]MCB5182733.1 hypothetical protein [Streptomyces antimicrobicus]